MSRFIQILSLFFGLVLLTNCEKEVLTGDKKNFIGTWNWKYTDVIHYCDGFAQYELRDPLSEETNYKIVISRTGKLSFMKNGVLLSEHKIKINIEYISDSGIVESNRKILAYIILDGDENNKRRFKGTQKKMQVQGFPIISTPDCDLSAVNFFTKN
jgi:hypothetical protein